MACPSLKVLDLRNYLFRGGDSIWAVTLNTIVRDFPPFIKVIGTYLLLHPDQHTAHFRNQPTKEEASKELESWAAVRF